jgi:predicted lipid-binding transport protein (Tim44 family)
VGTGRNLIYGDGTPIAMIIVGLFFEGTAVLFVFVLLGGLMARAVAAAARDDATASLRRSARKPATASSRSAVNPHR